MRRSLVLATENLHKLREFQQIFGESVEIISASAAGFNEAFAPEDERSYEENAIQKAVTVGKKINRWVIGDDSGLEIDAMNGAPGIISARFGNTSDAKIQRALVLDRLKSETNRNARFVCYLAFYSPSSHEAQMFFGEVCGKISLSEKGEDGFGYDPIFIPNGYEKTFAEISASEKNKISHRAAAIVQLRQILEGNEAS